MATTTPRPPRPKPAGRPAPRQRPWTAGHGQHTQLLGLGGETQRPVVSCGGGGWGCQIRTKICVEWIVGGFIQESHARPPASLCVGWEPGGRPPPGPRGAGTAVGACGVAVGGVGGWVGWGGVWGGGGRFFESAVQLKRPWITVPPDRAGSSGSSIFFFSWWMSLFFYVGGLLFLVYFVKARVRKGSRGCVVCGVVAGPQSSVGS